MRIHAFLEHWGLINFNVDANNKPSNTILPKVFNFKSPVYVDFSTKKNNELLNKASENEHLGSTKPNSSETKGIHENFNINNNNKNQCVEKTNGDELLENGENYLNQTLVKNSLGALNQTNFLESKFRPKCDTCSKSCDFEWYCKKSNSLFMDDLIVVCFNCFEKVHVNEQSHFELVNIYNLISRNEGIIVLTKNFMRV